MAVLLQMMGDRAADEAGRAGDENVHDTLR
jgi:hypothetical protein